MIYRQRRPVPILSRFIENFWFYEDLAAGHTKEKLLPNGSMELIIDLSPNPKKLYDRKDTTRFRTFRRAWVSGLQREYIIIGPEAGSSMMGVHFRPGGAAPFFTFPISELTSCIVELDLIWKEQSTSLRDRLLEGPDISRKFDLLEETLLARVRRHGLETDGSVAAVLDTVRRKPLLPLREIACDLGLHTNRVPKTPISACAQ